MIQIDEMAIRRALWTPANMALNEIAQTEIPVIKDQISVPVGRDVFGNAVERSKPGEPPRTDTGALLEGIASDIYDDADGNPVLEITSSRAGNDPSVPQKLEAMRRPFMSAAFNRLQGYAKHLIADFYRRM